MFIILNITKEIENMLNRHYLKKKNITIPYKMDMYENIVIVTPCIYCVYINFTTTNKKHIYYIKYVKINKKF